jgi:hypothetical protein
MTNINSYVAALAQLEASKAEAERQRPPGS